MRAVRPILASLVVVLLVGAGGDLGRIGSVASAGKRTYRVRSPRLRPGKGAPLHELQAALDARTGLTRTEGNHRVSDFLALRTERAARTSAAPRRLRDQARRDVRRREVVNDLIARDPILRLYAATQLNATAAAPDGKRGASGFRSRVPYLRLPAEPEGTVAVGLGSLVTRVAGTREPTLLRQAIENRPDKRVDELNYMVETFVRPSVKVFRVLIDRYGLAMFNANEKNLAFEMTATGRPTGRVVLNEFGGLWPDRTLMKARPTARYMDEIGAVDTTAAGLQPDLDEPRNLVHQGMNTLYDSIGALATTFHRDFGRRKGFSKAQIREAVDKAVAEELRYLNPDTARVLGKDTVMGRFVHSVPKTQHAALTRVLERVEQVEDAVVLVDQDFAGLRPDARIDAALRKVGRELAIPELGNPKSLVVNATGRSAGERILPTYDRASFSRFWKATGLADKYGARGDRFERALYVFTEAFFDKRLLSSDEPAPGLAAFVRQVERAGGRVVFWTGRRERDRARSEASLKKAGITDPETLMVPNDWKGDIGEAKRLAARSVNGNVVAAFDDSPDNLELLAGEFPQAVLVQVKPEGVLTAPRTRASRGVVRDFETARPAAAFQPRLASLRNVISDPGSLDRIDRIARLDVNPQIRARGVKLDRRQTEQVVRALMARMDAQVPRLVRDARARAARAARGRRFASDEERRAFELYQVMNAEPHIAAGTEDNWTWENARPRLLEFMGKGEPIRFLMPSFPIKEAKNRMKTLGILPDLAEAGALIRIAQLDRVVRQFYEPGVQYTILADGHHYREHFRETAGMPEAYMKKVEEYARLVDDRGAIRVVDYDREARRVLGEEVWQRRQARLGEIQAEYRRAFAGLDVTHKPLAALAQAAARSPEKEVDGLPPFDGLFHSLAFMVKIPNKKGADYQRWSKDVLSDLYNLTDPKASPELIAARKDVLRHAWDTTIGYLAAVRSDREVGFSRVDPGAIRATVHPKEGQYGFALLRHSGDANTPWHSTAAFSRSGELSMDMAISLQSAGLVPVYSEMLFRGNSQPLFFVPPEAVDGQGKLRPEFVAKMHLMP